MSKILFFWIYYSVCAVWMHLAYFRTIDRLNNPEKQDKDDKKFLESLDFTLKSSGLTSEQFMKLAYIFLMLFSWLIVPIKLIQKLLKVQV